MSQKDLVISHLAEYGSISREYAWKEYGIKRLGAVIHDLKELGYVFDTVELESDFEYRLRDDYEVQPREVAVKSRKRYSFKGF